MAAGLLIHPHPQMMRPGRRLCWQGDAGRQRNLRTGSGRVQREHGAGAHGVVSLSQREIDGIAGGEFQRGLHLHLEAEILAGVRVQLVLDAAAIFQQVAKAEP